MSVTLDAGHPAAEGKVGPHSGAPHSVARMEMRSWWMISVLLVIYILSMIDRRIISMLVVPIQKQLDLSDVHMGWLLGPAFAIANFLALMPFGWAADRWPRRWVLFSGVVLWSIATAGSGLAGSFFALALARILVGFGEAAVNPTAYSLIGDSVPRERLTLAMSIYQMGSKLSTAAAFATIALAALVATRIIALDLPVISRLQPWQITFLVTGLPGIAVGLLLFTFPEPRRLAPKVQGPPGTGALIAFLKQNRVLMALMLTVITSCAMAVYALNAWVPAYMEREYGMTPTQYGPILSIMSLAAAGTLILKGLLADYLFARGIKDAYLRLLSWFLAMSIPLAFLAFSCGNPILFLICFGLLELLVGQFFLYFAATIQLIVPPQIKGQFTALLLAAQTLIGMGIGPLAIAYLTEHVFGDRQALGLALLIFSVGTYAIAFVAIRLLLKSISRLVETQ